ncbi:MAG: hypothetical protein ACXIUM_13195 [Wenzhouxiangella sp.]
MTDRQQQIDAHNQATGEFIQLANDLVNNKGFDMKLVSAALMAASGVYATFTAAGNQGYLAPSGVDRVADMYKNNLGYIQERKKEELKAQGLEARPIADVQNDGSAGNQQH